MKKFISKTTTVVFALAMILGTLGISAQANSTAKNKKKPTVVVIRADWCSACQKVEPIVKSLKKEYAEKFNFVILDVTDENKEAASYKKAKSLGLGAFFKANKKKTSTVAIFNKTKKTFHTVKNYNRSDYVGAFHKASM